MGNAMRLRGTLIQNSICCAIGVLIWWNAAWIMAYWGPITGLWYDIWRLFR